MADKPTMVVLFDGTDYYAKHPNDYSPQWGEFRVNGHPVEVMPDKRWAKTVGKPKEVEFYVKPPRELVGYKLKQEHIDAGMNVPHEVPVEHFAESYDGDYTIRANADLYPLYEGVYVQAKPYWELKEWEILISDLKTVPTEMIPGVRCEPPNSFSKIPEVHHLFPCWISQDGLFAYMRGRILGAIQAAGKDKYDIGDYENIGSLRVGRLLKNYSGAQKRVDVSRFGAKKPKYQWRPDPTTTKGLFWLESKKLPILRAHNYADLLAIIDERCDKYLAMIDENNWSVCDCCRGFGYLLNGKPVEDKEER